MILKYMKNGGEVKPFPAIDETDMQKIGHYFFDSTTDPVKLQEEIVFYVLYYDAQRGSYS